MRRSSLQILASLCVLVVWIMTPLLSVVHVVVEEHRYCAEHERLEEDEGHAQGVERVSETSTSRVAPNTPAEPSGEHADCAFGDDFSRDDYILSHHLTLHVGLGFAPSAALWVAAPSLADLLLVAPKTSPPLVA